MAKTSVAKYTKLSSLEKTPKGSVWVLSSPPEGLPPSDLAFQVPKLRGTGKDVVRVVNTWIPQDLTETVTKEQLMESSEFRQTVSKGLVQLVTDEYAEKIMERNDAQVEKRRIDNLRRAGRSVLKAKPSTNDDDRPRSPTQARRQENIARVNEENQREGANNDADSFSIMLQKHEGEDETVIVNALKSYGKLSERQVRKARKTFKTHAKVVRWCDKRLDSILSLG